MVQGVAIGGEGGGVDLLPVDKINEVQEWIKCFVHTASDLNKSQHATHRDVDHLKIIYIASRSIGKPDSAFHAPTPTPRPRDPVPEGLRGRNSD